LLKLVKLIGLVSVKKGNRKGSKNGQSLQGTWIHRDLAIEYARWLDPEFSTLGYLKKSKNLLVMV